MLYSKYLLSLIAAFLYLIMQSCAQNVTDTPAKKLALTQEDSLKLNHYFDKLEKLPLFSQRRGLYIDSALAISPESAYMWQQRAMPLFKQKKYEIGMVYLDNAVKYNPNRYLDYRAFMKCIFSKNYTESIKDFQAAQTLKGNSFVMDHSCDFYIGLCYLQLNRLDSAEYFIKKTIEEEKKTISDETWIHFLHWFYLGIIKFEQEDYSTAVTYFDKTLKLYTRFSDAKYYKAICLENMQKEKEALSLMVEASENFEQGYTINEDNAIYETYPYQINKFYLKGYIDRLKQIK